MADSVQGGVNFRIPLMTSAGCTDISQFAIFSIPLSARPRAAQIGQVSHAVPAAIPAAALR